MDNSQHFQDSIQNSIQQLKRQNRLLFSIILTLIIAFVVSSFTFSKGKTFDSIRTKKIIIEDAEGKDRIILAARITESTFRVRKDELSGVLVLDENGQDRVILGASPFIKRRDGSIVRRATDGPYGIAFNDENGVEKGGMGYYSDKKLAVLGLDGPESEGIVLFVPQTELFGQKVGILVNDPQQGGQLFYIGASNTSSFINMDAPGKGRFSIEMDSLSNTTLKHYDYNTDIEKLLMKTD